MSADNNDNNTRNPSAGRWTLVSQDGFESGLQFDDSYLPTEADLGPEDVLVDMYAASLNYRDMAIAKAGLVATPLPVSPGVTPGSDGAGKILAVGSSVPPEVATLLKPGQDVVTHLAPFTTDSEMPGFEHIGNGLGQKQHGTLCRRGVFHHTALVPKPAGKSSSSPYGSFSYEQAASLTCSGLTAWNALMGVEGRRVKEGDWVLVMGSGGVSVAALQIAKAAGATVVATTSSPSKAARLKALGASQVINYRETPEWGAAARKLTPQGGRGFDHVVDVGGPLTAPQSLKAVRRDAVITMCGILGGTGGDGSGSGGGPVDIMATMWTICTVRGVILGSRDMLRDLLAFVAEKQVDIALDDEDKVFGLDQVKQAYDRLAKQEHFAKVVIKIR